MTPNRLGFSVQSSNLVGNILIPRYYSPEIPARLSELATRRSLVRLGDLIDDGSISVATGHEVGKMAYGTGSIPFVRTSDLMNWEIRGDPKQGVSEEIYREYQPRQDVTADDILFVRDGTYLIGNTAIVSQNDTPILYQSHVVRFRVTRSAPIDPFLLLGALSTPVVRRQVLSKQFTADIIDTIGNRYHELLLPVPSTAAESQSISTAIRRAVTERASLLQRLRFLPLWAEGLLKSEDFTRADFESHASPLGFTIAASAVGNGPLIPRFYSPRIDSRLAALTKTHDLVSIGELVEQGQLQWTTGIEVGKLAYGGGGPPFVRTSDFSTWELKIDPKQTVTAETYDRFDAKQDVRPEDVFVVRDGTYLVGSSAIVTAADCPLLFAGGIYKFRTTGLDPYLFLTLLNAPVVREQMRAKQFTRDVIDTLGKRIFEVQLPFPKDKQFSQWLSSEGRKSLTRRVELRGVLHDNVLALEGDAVAAEEEQELAQGPV